MSRDVAARPASVRSSAGGTGTRLPWFCGATLLYHDLDDLIGDELSSAHLAHSVESRHERCRGRKASHRVGVVDFIMSACPLASMRAARANAQLD